MSTEHSNVHDIVHRVAAQMTNDQRQHMADTIRRSLARRPPGHLTAAERQRWELAADLLDAA